MAEITRTIFVKVLTFDPAQGQLIPVPNATVLCEDRGWLWSPNLSSGEDTTNSDGLVEMVLTFEEDDESKLNPFFTVEVPEGSRAVPASAPSTRQVTLPDEWVTRHYVKKRIVDLTKYNNADSALEIYVGLPAHLRLSYSDFDLSLIRNPVALPEETVRVYLADYDDFLWIDWLNPDDTLEGFGYNPRTGTTTAVGSEADKYPYYDTFPTAPLALGQVPGSPSAWLDPPGEPLGSLGGGSFENTGPLAVDSHGFVWMVDGLVLRRFYPDGTLAETITQWGTSGNMFPFQGPSGLAVDQYRNLYVSDGPAHQIHVFILLNADGQAGTYQWMTLFGGSGTGPGLFNNPQGLAIVPNRVVDAEEFLVVADRDNHRVQLIRIGLPTGNPAHVTATFNPNLSFVAQFGAPSGSASATSPEPQAFWEPVGVAADRQKRIFVSDRAWHRVSRWEPNVFAAPTGYVHAADWETSGGGSGSGNREFNTPGPVAVDSKQGYIYVADIGNNRIQRLDSGSGAHLANWSPTPAPAAVAVDARGEVYVADVTNKTVIRGTVYDNSGIPGAEFTPPAPVGTPWVPSSHEKHFNTPSYVAFGPQRRLWVCDTNNNRVLMYEPDSNGVLTLNALRITTDLNQPRGIVVTPEGQVFVSDTARHRVRSYDPALTHQSDVGTTDTPGTGDAEFNNPCGIAYAVRTDGLSLYVADRDNDRVKIIKSDGTFAHLTGDGTTNFNKPEDVAVDSAGNVYVADTGGTRIVKFKPDNTFDRVITLNAHGQSFNSICGISVDDQDYLIVTDRGTNTIYRMKNDGSDLVAYWDLRRFLRQSVDRAALYEPELANLLLFNQPLRAVINPDGLMAVADSGHHRVRLVRVYTNIDVSLFELGEGLPELSLRVGVDANWEADLGLKVDVTDLAGTKKVRERITEPVEDFSDDDFTKEEILDLSDGLGPAVNVLKIVRVVQKFFKEHSRQAQLLRRWGTELTKRSLDIDADAKSSYYFLEVNLGETDSSSPHRGGRGMEAWDDSVIAHEMSHWLFTKNTWPYPILPGLLNIPRWIRLARSHSSSFITSFDQALSEGWAEYVEHFWGSEFAAGDRLRGFPLRSFSFHPLTDIHVDGGARQYLFGGSSLIFPPLFNTPQIGLQNEGYLSQALYQFHRAIVDPGVLFADSPAYWHPYNIHVSDAASQRFSQTIWRALERFQNDPPLLDRASQVFMTQLLDETHRNVPEFAQLLQSLFELNNQLMPVITITQGTSSTSPGTEIDGALTIEETGTLSLIVRVTDATNRPLAGYNVFFTVSNSSDYSFSGTAPAVQHGRVSVPLNRATNENGIVNITFQAPPGSAGRVESFQATYQPDFDTDTTFDPPQKGDSLEMTLRKLYLYELRSSVKIWWNAILRSGNNFGAQASSSLTINVTASS